MISRDEIGQHPASRNVVARLTFAAARSMRSLITVISLAAPCRTPPRAGTSPPKHSSRLWPWLSSHGNTSARIGNSVSLRPRGMRPSSCLSKDGCISCGKASHETGRTGWSFNEPIEPMRGVGCGASPRMSGAPTSSSAWRRAATRCKGSRRWAKAFTALRLQAVALAISCCRKAHTNRWRTADGARQSLAHASDVPLKTRSASTPMRRAARGAPPLRGCLLCGLMHLMAKRASPQSRGCALD
jgi:hypothetical protein